MATINPTFMVTAPVRPLPLTDEPEYPPGLLIDFSSDPIRLVIDASGRPVLADGYRAWVQWCAKTVLTERGAYRAYRVDYGVALEDARALADPDLAQATAQRAIVEALMRDRRTGSVTNFRFQQVADQLMARFTIAPRVSRVGPPVDVTTWLTAA